MKLAIAVILISLVLLASLFNYLPGRQTYWDYKITELCGKDGGLVVFQAIHISKANVTRGVLPLTWPSGSLGKGGPLIGVTVKTLAHKDAPAYIDDEKRTNLREWNPEVWRVEQTIVRGTDRVVAARQIYYYRIGGDFPSFAHPSSFRCPDSKRMSGDMQKLFVVQ